MSAQVGQEPSRLRSGSFWKAFRSHPASLPSLILILLATTVAVSAGLLPIPGPNELGVEPYLPPGSSHWLGTDHLGRDVLSRVIYGTRVALVVAFGSAFIATLIGIVVGGIAGYFGGWLDDLLSRTADAFLLVPRFFLLILIVALFGQGLGFVMLVIGLTTWPRAARLMRAEAVALRQRTFVIGARASGATRLQTLTRHVIPNGLSPVITNATIVMGQAIIVEAGLSFLGLGDPQTVSWGRMILDGRSYIDLAPWMSIFPGLAMFLLVLAMNLVGDGLTGAFNPKLRKGGS